MVPTTTKTWRFAVLAPVKSVTTTIVQSTGTVVPRPWLYRARPATMVPPRASLVSVRVALPVWHVE